MIVDDFYVVGIAVFIAKADTPACINGHGPLSRAVALELVQADALERAQVLQTLRGIERGEQILGSLGVYTPERGAFAFGMEPSTRYVVYQATIRPKA